MRNKKNIFIIDDDQAIGESLGEVLNLDYEVTLFTRGYEAIESLRHMNPDGILLDYFLPGEDTKDIINKFKAHSSKLPIIIMSANLNMIEDKPQLPAQDFLEKPFQMEKMLTSLSKYI